MMDPSVLAYHVFDPCFLKLLRLEIVGYLTARQTDGQTDRLQSIMCPPMWNAPFDNIDGKLACLFSGRYKSLTDRLECVNNALTL